MNYNNKKNLPEKFVKSVGACVMDEQQRVLILFQKQNRYWEFPKGKVEPGEEKEEMDTLRREIEEETGLKDFEIIQEFRQGFKYQFVLHGQFITKNNIFYLAKTKSTDVTISDEHLEFKWVSLAAVNRYFKHKNQRIFVYKLREFLEKNG